MMDAEWATVGRPTQGQVDFYRAQGYLKFGRIFTRSEMDALRDHVDSMIEALPEGKRPEAMDVPHFTDPWLFRYLTDFRVLDVIESFIGPDIILWSSHFIAKPRGDGKAVPWHTDGSYWDHRLEPMRVITLWLAVDPSTRANGCMKVIPRTLHGYSDYEPVDKEKNVFPIELQKAQRDESRAVYLELQPNHASLHDGRLMHGSDPNTSDLRRCGYTMRYMSAKVKMNEEFSGTWHQVYLARGNDRAGNKYADPGKSYEHMARYREETGKRGH